jgi:hypothetical protein
MNYGSIYRRVISEGGFDTSAGNVPLAQVQQWVAERYKELVLESEWLTEKVTLGTLLAGQSVYTFDNLAIDRLRLIAVGGLLYTRVGVEQMMQLKTDRLGLSADADGAYAPSYDASGTISLALFPGPTVAGAELVGILNAEPPALVAEADTPVIPEPYHVGLVWGAVATGLMLVDEDQQSAAGYEQKFEKVKAELTRRKNKRVGSGPVQVQIAGIHF